MHTKSYQVLHIAIKSKHTVQFVEWCPTGFKVGIKCMHPSRPRQPRIFFGRPLQFKFDHGITIFAIRECYRVYLVIMF